MRLRGHSGCFANPSPEAVEIWIIRSHILPSVAAIQPSSGFKREALCKTLPEILSTRARFATSGPGTQRPALLTLAPMCKPERSGVSFNA